MSAAQAGFAGRVRGKAAAAPDDGARTLGGACAVVIGALVVTGGVTHELLRYAVLATPALAAAALCLARRPWAKWAVAPILGAWLALPLLSWSALGLDGARAAHIFRTTFSAPQIAMTIVLAAASGLGLARIARKPGGAAWPQALGASALFAAVQLAATLVSLQSGMAQD